MTINPTQQLVQLEDIIPETSLVAMIRRDMRTLSEIHNLELKQSYDDLDYLEYAILPLSLDRRVSLLSHKHSPEPGVEICVRHDQQDISTVLYETFVKLNLTLDDLTWIQSEYMPELYVLIFLRQKIKCFEHSKFSLLTDLSCADLSNAPFKSIKLNKADLRKTNFRKAELGLAFLQEANLEESNLYDADLRQANLQGANLQRANLKDANLRGANLQGANLKYANLQSANLQGANLKGADLTHAYLDNATLLTDADLRNTQLGEIEFDTNTMWLNIIGLHKATRIPENLRKNRKFAYGIELSKGIEELTQNHDVKKFREIYKSAINEIDEIENKDIIASLWNKIAWLSTLYGYPDEESHKSALKAITLMNYKGNYHDTLGMILALRKNHVDAIKEFQIALKSKDVQEWPQSFIDRRKDWIKDLQLGHNPFGNENLIKVLRKEER
jgi:uncharacterized protein YjbI with pentapeptide repeats